MGMESAHDGHSCINLLSPSPLPYPSLHSSTSHHVYWSSLLTVWLPLNSPPWSPFSEIQQLEGSFQREILPYHLLQKTLSRLPIAFSIELRPPGMASHLLLGLAFLLQPLLLPPPPQSLCCSSRQHPIELIGMVLPGVQHRSSPEWWNTGTRPESNCRNQVLDKAMLLNQTTTQPGFHFLGLCTLPSEGTMMADIIKRNKQKIDL